MSFIFGLFGFLCLLFYSETVFAASGDIVFVTQVPDPDDFVTVVATFGNHDPKISLAPRGGDLYIRYSDGTLKNITAAAGYGNSGMQGTTSIAVRDPAVHWSGSKVIFSMVIGAPQRQFDYSSKGVWQLYEVTGLGRSETPVITKVPNQPVLYNNVMPTYGTDDQIIFITDRPHNGASHLYPQLDEYESKPTNTGLWKLNPADGTLVLLDHTPSGAFHPFVDSFGRVIYTRWDHLQRDQQNEGGGGEGAFNYSSELPGATSTGSNVEIFPEVRVASLSNDPNQNGLRFNHFFPWQINEDGTEHETLNHVGRHELHNYFERAFLNDSNLHDFTPGGRFNPNSADNFFHIDEDPRTHGTYYAINAPEFETHSSGALIKFNGSPVENPNRIAVTYVSRVGSFRDPLPTTLNTLIVSHTSATGTDDNVGTGSSRKSKYDFRLKTVSPNGTVGGPLTPGISKSISWWSPDSQLSYNGLLWELQPVEFVARNRPARKDAQLDSIEASVFSEEGVTVAAVKQYLRNNNLALIISRNLTTRDLADEQQPYNLRVPGGVQTTANTGRTYDISHLQILQGDQIRGYSNISPNGRRLLAIPLHDGKLMSNPGGPAGSVKIALDGSSAALVPARRALTWHITDSTGKSVVKERYWLTFQPGEIRVCTSCHGINDVDQAGNPPPKNKPQALRELINFIRGSLGSGGVQPACDLNSSGSVTVADVQLCANQTIGTMVCANGDVDKNGQCNVLDLQKVVNGALGGSCP